jgi:hypothetical protein
MPTQNIYKIYVALTKKFYTQSRISDKLDIDSSHINIKTSMMDERFAKAGVQVHFTKALLLFWYYTEL